MMKSKTRLYWVWAQMNRRCHTPTSSAYHKYGARGITVCQRWRKSFDAFAADMGPRPTEKHTLDRINTNGNYTPSNCRWATPKEQARNRRSTVWVTYDGRRMCLKDWAAEVGINYRTVKSRINRDGKTPLEALELS